jgi:peptidoglycan/LPS O-acetylase OafA/YrhL
MTSFPADKTAALPAGSLESKRFRLGYRPALDGLRAISILAVMGFHSSYLKSYTPGGFIGVDIFFVLSGFLIMSLLLEEHERTGRIDLAAFYVRRALRLLPALFVLLGGMWVALGLIGGSYKTDASLMAGTTFFVLFYLTNWVLALRLTGWPRPLRHMWSLAIEEQFYLAWPLFVRFALARKLSRQAILTFTLLCIAAVALWRAYLWHSTHDGSRCYNGTDTRADGILVGCVVALIASSGWLRRIPVFSALGAIFLVVVISQADIDASYMPYAGLTLVPIAAGLVVVEILFSPPKLLTLTPLVWTGRLSYGLYLWHFPINCVVEKSPLKDHPVAGVFAEFGGAFLCASVSYYVVERPMLKLKRKFETKRVAIPSE